MFHWDVDVCYCGHVELISPKKINIDKINRDRSHTDNFCFFLDFVFVVAADGSSRSIMNFNQCIPISSNYKPAPRANLNLSINCICTSYLKLQNPTIVTCKTISNSDRPRLIMNFAYETSYIQPSIPLTTVRQFPSFSQ